MMLFRWLATSVLVAAATMAYSVLVGLATAFLFPDAVRYYHTLFAHESVVGAAVRSAVDWGWLAALFMGPCLGFTLVRDFNAFLEKPGHEKHFWRSVLRSAGISFFIVAAGGFGSCGVGTLVLLIQGGAPEVIHYRGFLILVLGHMAAALVVTIGHFVRNPPDLSLGSSDDLRSSPDRPPRH